MPVSVHQLPEQLDHCRWFARSRAIKAARQGRSSSTPCHWKLPAHTPSPQSGKKAGPGWLRQHRRVRRAALLLLLGLSQTARCAAVRRIELQGRRNILLFVSGSFVRHRWHQSGLRSRPQCKCAKSSRPLLLQMLLIRMSTFDVQVSVSNTCLASLTVGNGAEAERRVALADLQVQLLDEHGNAAGCTGAEVQVQLFAREQPPDHALDAAAHKIFAPQVWGKEIYCNVGAYWRLHNKRRQPCRLCWNGKRLAVPLGQAASSLRSSTALARPQPLPFLWMAQRPSAMCQQCKAPVTRPRIHLQATAHHLQSRAESESGCVGAHLVALQTL